MNQFDCILRRLQSSRRGEYHEGRENNGGDPVNKVRGFSSHTVDFGF
jgi:hypothetical protein